MIRSTPICICKTCVELRKIEATLDTVGAPEVGPICANCGFYYVNGVHTCPTVGTINYRAHDGRTCPSQCPGPHTIPIEHFTVGPR